MKIWLKIEYILLKLSRQLGNVCYHGLKKIIPPHLWQKLDDAAKKPAYYFQKFKTYLFSKALELRNRFRRQLTAESKEKMKLQTQERVKRSKEMAEKLRGLGFIGLLSFLISQLSYLKKWILENVFTQTVILNTTLAGVSIGAGLVIFHHVDEILIKEGIRTPAAEEIYQIDTRPEYHLKDKKHFILYGLILPLEIKSVTDITSLKIDLVLETSNRTTKLFIEENEYLLRDHLYTHIQNLDGDFSLTNEGYWVIEDKVRIEVNNYLKLNGQQGDVREVYVKNVLGG